MSNFDRFLYCLAIVAILWAAYTDKQRIDNLELGTVANRDRIIELQERVKGLKSHHSLQHTRYIEVINDLNLVAVESFRRDDELADKIAAIWRAINDITTERSK